MMLVCVPQMEERPAESASIASASSAPRPSRPAHEDPLQTDIVQILAKIKGKVRPHAIETDT